MATGLPLKIIADGTVEATKLQYAENRDFYAEHHFTALRRSRGL